MKIKGPLKIRKGDIADFIKEKVGEAKLPFSATGWNSTRNNDRVKGSVPTPVVASKPAQAVPKPVVAAPKVEAKKTPKAGQKGK